ncbi:DNA-binding protein G5P [Salmonella enterica]|nr:DNA-binding protein G5P [Salmonella enterica]EJB9092707.1 DNA-binding protein G5P [Salmonella enterica]EJB9131092.1 DNA-binding protein G5P [Salmonella enterica]EJB9138560.1 DNA-binding protein G5P [Salmonella enterica]EJB9344463.1 DNA-binding protein G5P [Salmonella enterica]
MSNLLNLETTVTGKIKRYNNSGGFYYTTVVSPAADAYSYPPVVRIKSKKSLGRIGDEIMDAHCRITGYERSFPYTDKQTGEQIKGYNVDMLLELIE